MIVETKFCEECGKLFLRRRATIATEALIFYWPAQKYCPEHQLPILNFSECSLPS